MTSDKGYDLSQAILQMILDGEFKPGDRLAETDLAQRLGVSRSPVRVALRSLEKTGVVEVRSNRGAWVRTYTADDVARIYEARTELEPLVASLALPHLNDDDVAHLTALADQIDAEISGDAHPAAIAELNNQFHTHILAKCPNRYLADAAIGLLQPLVISRTFQQYTDLELRRSSRHHYEILDAITCGDAIWLRSIMAAHIRFGSYSSRKRSVD